jgi:hypothetical protein
MEGHGNGHGNGNGAANGNGTGAANGNENGNGNGTTNGNGTANGNGTGIGPGKMAYLVLGGAANPYLLARVRWPDIAQAITAGCTNWLDDVGIFDLPYEAISSEVTYTEAAAIASRWGASLPSEETAIECARPLIRRMPAEWSRLTPAEERAWSLEFVTTGLRADAIRQRAEAGDSRRRGSLLARLRKALGGFKYPDEIESSTPPTPAPSSERRLHARVPARGRGQIRCGNKTVSATLVDMSPGGARWHIVDSHAALEVGEQLDPSSLVVEGDGSGNEISLDVSGTVMWGETTALGAEFGVAFEPLSADETDRVRHLLLSSTSPRSA